MRSLPLFHRIDGQPVIVLGEGEAALPKRRLVERAGARVISDLQQGIDEGARLAFIAHNDADMCQSDAIRLRGAGLLVNVVDRPELCDFTTPSLLERDPVLIAIGTSGASAGLAKHVRLRLEALLPSTLGKLAEALFAARASLRRLYPDGAARRRALDLALQQDGPLDPLDENSANKVEIWLEGAGEVETSAVHEILISSDDADDLTLRQARLLGMADVIVAEPGIAAQILERSRADAARLPHPHKGDLPPGLVVILRQKN